MVRGSRGRVAACVGGGCAAAVCVPHRRRARAQDFQPLRQLLGGGMEMYVCVDVDGSMCVDIDVYLSMDLSVDLPIYLSILS